METITLKNNNLVKMPPQKIEPIFFILTKVKITIIKMNSVLPRDFVDACREGHLETAQHILKTNPTHNFYYKFQIGFNYSCVNGHLDVAQWLLTVENNKIDISFDQNYNFKWACGNGHLDVAQWFYERVSQTLSDNEKYNLCKEAFMRFFGHQHLHVAQWLFNMCKSPICWIDDAIFRYNCNYNNIEVVKWFCSLMPFKYSFTNYEIHTNKNIKLMTLIYLLTRSNNFNYLTANVVFKLNQFL